MMGRLKLSNETKTSLIALTLIAITALANIGPSLIAAFAAFGWIHIPNPSVAAYSGVGIAGVGATLCMIFCPAAISGSASAAVTAAAAASTIALIGCTAGLALVGIGVAIA
ncbi:hypothetical protein B7L70_02700 [Vulcanisaeta sp. EB80]|nr:hypothetical protein B7L70_02700 [Vulcanisaeta sp. EB80]